MKLIPHSICSRICFKAVSWDLYQVIPLDLYDLLNRRQKGVVFKVTFRCRRITRLKEGVGLMTIYTRYSRYPRVNTDIGSGGKKDIFPIRSQSANYTVSSAGASRHGTLTLTQPIIMAATW